MEKKTLKQSLRDVFTFKWLKKGPRKASEPSYEAPRRVPRRNTYRSPYYRERGFWERIKDRAGMAIVIVIAFLMTTCAGVDFLWKGNVG